MPLLGEIAALITALLWSGTSIAFAEASLKIGSVMVNVSRLVFAAFYLGLTILLVGLEIHLSSSQYFFLIMSGIVGLTIGDSFLMEAFKRIGARISMLVMSLSPPFAAVFAYVFLNEVLSFWGVMGIVVTVLGVSIVVLQKEEKQNSSFTITWQGILLAILGALGQAGGLIFAKCAFNESKINGFVATFIRIIAALIFLIPLGFLIRQFKNPIKVFKREKKALLQTSIAAFFSSHLGITLSLVAITYTYVGIASTLMATVPVIMLPLVRFYYKEHLTWKSITGAFIAVSGVAILFLK